jgi:hypothetical protein
LRVGRLLTLHFFLGMVLLGPVALKARLIASLLAGLVIALLTVHLEGQWRPTGIPVHFKR